MSNLSFVELLEQEFELRKARNVKYSKRAYCSFLEISIGALSELLSGKRKLTDSYIEKLGMKLGLNLEEIQRYQRKEKLKIEFEKDHEEVNYDQVQIDAFGLISDWYVMAIFHLIDKKGVKHNAAEFAHRLGISSSEAQTALQRLQRLGLIKYNGKKYSRTGQKFLTTLSVEQTSQAAKNFQIQMLHKSIEAVEQQDTDERDHSGMTLLIDKNEIVKAKEMIKRFRRNFGKIFGEDNLNGDVYQIQIGLFKLSK